VRVGVKEYRTGTENVQYASLSTAEREERARGWIIKIFLQDPGRFGSQ